MPEVAAVSNMSYIIYYWLVLVVTISEVEYIVVLVLVLVWSRLILLV